MIVAAPCRALKCQHRHLALRYLIPSLLLVSKWVSVSTARLVPVGLVPSAKPTIFSTPRAKRMWNVKLHDKTLPRGSRQTLFTRLRMQASGDDKEELPEEDWRDFRARLVKQSLGEVSDPLKDDGWAYQTDLLEEGSLLVSVPGDHWSITRQYFCKVVFLVISHTPQFTAAVVLNRPTNLTTSDINHLVKVQVAREQRIESDGIWELYRSSTEDAPDWPVWFGGDGEGLESLLEGRPPKLICLHTLERLADRSRKVIRGIFLIDFKEAHTLVQNGQASQDDFMLIAGYTGWGPGQLQSELDRGGAWILGAADQGLLLGNPGESHPSLISRLRKACARRNLDGSISQSSQNQVGDGIHHWNMLYKSLRPKEFNELDPEEESHNDEMIRLWIEAYLLPEALKTATRALLDNSTEGLTPPKALAAGTIFRGSGTAWILGRPTGSWPTRARPDAWQIPGQYMHKGVLLLLSACTRDQPAALMLLNGPKIGSTSLGADVHFGGPEGINSLSIPASKSEVIAGTFALPAGTLQQLLETGALSIANTTREDVFTTRHFERWQVAGGKLESLTEAMAAVQGDKQQAKWYRAILDLDLNSEK